MSELLGADWRFMQTVDRLGLVGCLPLVLTAICILAARWHWLWYVLPLLAVSWLPYIVLKRSHRYKAAERRASEQEQARPHYVLSLTPTQQDGLSGGFLLPPPPSGFFPEMAARVAEMRSPYDESFAILKDRVEMTGDPRPGVQCIFSAADLSEADLRGSTFEACAFDRAVMRRAKLHRRRALLSLLKRGPDQEGLPLSADQRSEIAWSEEAPEPGGG